MSNNSTFRHQVFIKRPGDPSTSLPNEIAERLDFGHYRQAHRWVSCAAPDRAIVSVVTDDQGEVLAFSHFMLTGLDQVGLTAAIAERGPISVSDNALCQHLGFVSHLFRNKAMYISIQPWLHDDLSGEIHRHLTASGWQRARASRLYDSTVIVPVAETVEAQWRGLRRSMRTAINKSRRANITVTEAKTDEHFQSFAAHFDAFARRKGLARIQKPLLREVASTMAHGTPPRAFLLRAQIDGHSAGDILLIRHGSQLVFEWGWTDPSAVRNRIPVMHRLLWESIDLCRREGLREFDLGGFWIDKGNSDPINHFKLGFSKEIRHVGDEWQLILAPKRLLLYRRLRQLVGRR